jgi:hypothetical protein
VPPHSAVINETIAAADATNPRNDLVVLEIKDTQHDASGSNLAQTRVVTGTPNVSATQTYGVNGRARRERTRSDAQRPPARVAFGGSGGKSIIGGRSRSCQSVVPATA